MALRGYLQAVSLTWYCYMPQYYGLREQRIKMQPPITHYIVIKDYYVAVTYLNCVLPDMSGFT